MTENRVEIETADGNDYVEHERVYEGFVQGSVAGVMICLIALIALIAMAVIGGLAFWIGLFGLFIGLLTVTVTLISAASWSSSLLVVLGMIVLCLPFL